MNPNFKKKVAALGLSLVMATGTVYGNYLPNATIVTAKSTNKYKVNSYGVLTEYSGSSNVHIRANVSALNATVFDNTNVTSFSVSSNNKYLKAVDGVLYTKDGKKLVRYPSGRKGSFTIPSTVTSIAQNAFRGCDSLTSLQVPESVSIIGSGAFYNCKKLKTINIPSNVTALRKEMFYHCRSLESITLPSKLEVLGTSAFEGCTSLKSVNLPSSLKNIKRSTFRNCNSLTEISIPGKVKAIRSYAFKSCDSLETVKLGSNLEVIDYYAFANCNSLKNITIPGSVNSIGTRAFSGCKNLKNLTVQNGVSEIGAGAFTGCSSLETIKIPNSVSTINSKAFANCSNLEQVTLSNRLSYISSFTFSNCKKLKSVDLPSSITSIYDYAFRNCVSLTKIKIPKNVKSIRNNAFQNAGTAFSVDSSNKTFSSEDGVLYNAQKTTLLKFPAYKSGNYKTLDTVTTISSAAFKYCQKLNKVTISEGIKTINKNCFNHSSIKELSLPSTLKSLASSSSKIDTPNLVNVSIDESNKYFTSESGMLYSKDKAILYIYPTAKTGTVKFPKEASNLSNISSENKASAFTVTSGSAVYASDDGMLTTKAKNKICAVPSAKTSYNMGSKMKNIDVLLSVKSSMNNLKKFTVDKKNTKYSAKNGVLMNIEQTKIIFYPNAKSGSYTVPSSITKIRSDAFSYTNKLTNLIIRKNVTSCNMQLYDCSALKNITIKEGSLRNLTLYTKGNTNISKITLPTSLVSGKISNYDRNIDLSKITIVGWTNTTAEKIAKRINAKFVSSGIVPKQVKNVHIKAYVHLKRIKISWKQDPQVSGYEIYSENKKLKTITNNSITEADLYVGDSYNTTLYIRAYKIQKGKKVYGKSKKITYLPYS